LFERLSAKVCLCSCVCVCVCVCLHYISLACLGKASVSCFCGIESVCVFELPASALNTVQDVCISEWGMTGRTGALSLSPADTHTHTHTLYNFNYCFKQLKLSDFSDLSLSSPPTSLILVMRKMSHCAVQNMRKYTKQQRLPPPPSLSLSNQHESCKICSDMTLNEL